MRPAALEPIAVGQSPQALRRYRQPQRRPGVEHRHAALQPAGPVQGNGSYALFIQVLLRFECVGFVVYSGVERLVQWWKVVADNFHHRAMHLGDRPDLHAATLEPRQRFDPGRELVQAVGSRWNR